MADHWEYRVIKYDENHFVQYVNIDDSTGDILYVEPHREEVYGITVEDLKEQLNKCMDSTQKPIIIWQNGKTIPGKYVEMKDK
jgi:hypothetical protein